MPTSRTVGLRHGHAVSHASYADLPACNWGADSHSPWLITLQLTGVTSGDDHVLAAIDNVCSALCKLISGPSASVISYDAEVVFKVSSGLLTVSATLIHP